MRTFRPRWALRRGLAEQVAMDVDERPSNIGNRSENGLRIFRAAIPNAQQISDLPQRQFHDPLSLVDLKNIVQELPHLKRIAQDRLTARDQRAAREPKARGCPFLGGTRLTKTFDG